MGKVGGAMLDGPDLHGFGNFVGHRQLQGQARGDAVLPGVIDRRGQPLLHDRLVKYVASKDFRYVQMFAHSVSVPFLKKFQQVREYYS